MRISAALVGLVGAAAGVSTGVATYQSSAEVTALPDHDNSPVLAVGRPLPDHPPQVERQLADCVPPATLEGGVCVTRLVQAVPAPAAEPASQSAPKPPAKPATPKAAPAVRPPRPAAAPPAAPAPAQAPAPAAAPAPAPAAPAPAAPSSFVWNGAAGSLVVNCQGSTITLQSATPSDGYEVDVKEHGPEEVEVEFESDDHETTVEAACFNGTAGFHAEEDD